MSAVALAGQKSAPSASTPIMFAALRVRMSRGRPAIAGGMAASALASLARTARVRSSSPVVWGSTALMTTYWPVMPICRSSPLVRSISASAEACGRPTRTILVWAGSFSALTARAYTAFCFSRPESGPRQDASPLPAARKSFQDPGSCSRRMVWPVGAVSKTMWSYWPIRFSSASRAVNSLNEAISVVHEPDSCSVIEASSLSGSSPRTGAMIRSR